ncbi:hypothetical protein D1007_15486 [Hordeum vulgare]|nr:hypothetical protein D1007_15486 [Hordeum vulgare]
MLGADDSQSNFSEPHAKSDSSSSHERTPSDPRAPSSHGMLKGANRSRKKLNSDEEDSDFVPEVVRKGYTKPFEAKLSKKLGVNIARKRIVHVIGRQTSMYEDPAETTDVDDEEEETPGAVTRVAVGNISGAAQDEHVSRSLDCDDTQICGAEDVNINENQDDVGAEHNPIEDSNPMENVKSTEEDVCGSLDEWLQNSVPFVVELEEATYVTFDVLPPCSSDVNKQSSRRKAVDEPTTDEVVVEVAVGALSNRASSRAHQPNRSNVVELHARTSASVNEDNADYYENEKKQVSCGEDVEHGPQLSHLNYWVPTSVVGDWSDVPSMSFFQDGTKEYD